MLLDFHDLGRLSRPATLVVKKDVLNPGYSGALTSMVLPLGDVMTIQAAMSIKLVLRVKTVLDMTYCSPEGELDCVYWLPW